MGDKFDQVLELFLKNQEESNKRFAEHHMEIMGILGKKMRNPERTK